MSPAGPTERGRPQTGAVSGSSPPLRWPIAWPKTIASSGRVVVWVRPRGLKSRSFIASSQVCPVTTSMIRPSTEKPELQ